MLMPNEFSVSTRVGQVKSSLDQLQNCLLDDEYSEESIKRLGRALSDMNEEVQLLKNLIQLSKPHR